MTLDWIASQFRAYRYPARASINRVRSKRGSLMRRNRIRLSQVAVGDHYENGPDPCLDRSRNRNRARTVMIVRSRIFIPPTDHCGSLASIRLLRKE